MATLQNSVHLSDIEFDPSSFQEVYTTSYSHGLESIYKLENVDLKSIRKLSAPKEEVSVPVLANEWQEDQLSFDLGAFYQGWMTPFVLSEPIQVLQLSKPIEKNLISLGYKNLMQLKSADLYSLKLGQGHIVDIQTKLKGYLHNKPLKKTECIDFCSLAKCIFGDKDPCKAYLLLEPYNLHQWISLSPSESVEVKRSIPEPLNVEASDYFIPIIETWINPWIHARGGIATKDELIEFLILRSLDEEFAKNFLELFKEHIFSTLLNLKSCFASSKQSANRFRLIEMTGLSYFNQPDAEFSLNHFMALIVDELGLKGHAVTSEQIFKVVKISDYYKVYRNSKGEWRVQENPLQLKS